MVPKDEYHIHVADMLIDSTSRNEILSLMGGYSRYNHIYIEEDIPKTTFRCPGAIGTIDRGDFDVTGFTLTVSSSSLISYYITLSSSLFLFYDFDSLF